jgi:hypothetical protein
VDARDKRGYDGADVNNAPRLHNKKSQRMRGEWQVTLPVTILIAGGFIICLKAR